MYTYLTIGKDSSIVAFKTAAERSRKRARIAASCGYDYREVQEGEIVKEEERGEQASRGVLVWESDRGGGGDQRGEIHLSMTPRVTSSNTSSCLVSWLNTRLNLMERTRRKEERKRREGVWESGRRKRKNERERNNKRYIRGARAQVSSYSDQPDLTSQTYFLQKLVWLTRL